MYDAIFVTRWPWWVAGPASGVAPAGAPTTSSRPQEALRSP